jgi:uncharacterized membrane protein
MIARLPEGTPPDIVEMVAHSAFFSGPLPPPGMFERYDQILPGAADRILALSEKEQAMRRRDNGWVLFNDSLRVSGSMVVSLALIGAGAFCGYINQPELGGILGASGAVGVIIRAFNRPK